MSRTENTNYAQEYYEHGHLCLNLRDLHVDKRKEKQHVTENKIKIKRQQHTTPGIWF